MKRIKQYLLGITLICVGCGMTMGCSTRHEVEMKPVEVKPIHITIDVNVRVDRALDDFFDDIDAAEEKMVE